jgi:hypothetical protein
MSSLQAYASIFIVGSIRGLFVVQYRKRRERISEAYNEEERQPLLGWSPLIHDAERGSPLKAKVICVLAALCYIIPTIYSELQHVFNSRR